MKTGLDSLDTGAPKITYSGNEGPKAPMQRASYRPGRYDPEEIEMYEQYKYDMEEQMPGMPIMEIDEFLKLEKERARIGVAGGGIAMQGGGPNYLGKQPEVTVPRKWKSSPDHPDTELAYITEPEKKVLIALNMHGGLEDGKPNKGPKGVISLQGDMGSFRGPAKGPNPPSTSSGENNRNDPPSNFRTSNVMNPENVKAGVNRNVKSLTDLQGGLIGGAGSRGAYDDPDDQPIKDLQDFYDKPANYPKYTPKVIQFLGNLNRRPNREFFVNRVLRAGKIPGLSYDDIYNEDFNIEEAYQQYMSNRMAGKTDAMGNPIEGFSYDQQGNLVGGFIDNRDDSQGIMSTAMLPPTNTTPPPPPGIPVSPVTGQYSNQYFIPGASNFYSNLPSTMFNPTTNMLTLADGGRANFAGGGIADLRQGYFLGKLVKSVTKPFKGIFKGIKKVAKSPAGKLALMAALGNIPIGQGGTALQRLGGIFSGGNKVLGPNDSILGGSSIADFFSGLGDKIQANPLNYILGASGLAGIYTALANKNMPDPFADYQRRLDKERANFAEIPIDPVQFSQGGIAGARTSALNELYGIDDEDEVKKLSQGGSAGLPPVTMMSEGQNIQSFPDDESTGMAQATPQNQMPMPMRPPMMDPRIQQQMMMSRSMSPMMNRGIMSMQQPRTMAQGGGIMMASNPDIMDERNELSLKMFQKPIDLLTPEEMDMLNDEVERLMQKFSSAPSIEDSRNEMMEMLARDNFGKDLKDLTDEEIIEIEEMMFEMDPYGSKPMARPRVMAQEGGMMDMGGMEKDYRNEGGFVAIGGQERADDVPARLSKNEFVFTADAVRNAGGGDIDKGAEIMENMMENLEAGGKVSEASQGLKGARQMFQTSQRLEEVL